MGLLRRDPMQRMTGQEAARILERDSAVSVEARPSQADADPPFVGRHRHLNALETALREAKHGTATAVYVHGPSGIGKSALVQCFLDRVLSREDIVVLRGRCYEYESVPYKALDGVIDSLSRHLSALPRSQADSAASARPGGAVTALSGHAAGRGGSVGTPRANTRTPIHSSCGSEHSRRCASC